MLDKPIREVMVTDLLTFSPDDNVRDAMTALIDAGYDAAPVVDAGGRVVGIISSSDLIVQGARLHFPTIVNFLGVNVEIPSLKERHLNDDIDKALGQFVREVMHADPATISPEASVQDAATVLHEKDVSRLPVVDDAGLLIGLVSRTDILRALIAEP